MLGDEQAEFPKAPSGSGPGLSLTHFSPSYLVPLIP